MRLSQSVMVGESGGARSAKGQIILGGRTTYGNSGNSENAFITEIGGTPANSMLMEYLNFGVWGTWPGISTDNDVWSAIGGFAPNYTGWPGMKSMKIPLQVSSSPLTWTDVTGGGQDSNWNSYFTWAHTNNVIVQIPGWEMNGNWYPWGIEGNDTVTNQQGFTNAWIHIWNLANALFPGFFKWWWNPTTLQATSPASMVPGGPYDPGAVNPKYVDGYGPDIYNNASGYGSFPGDNVMLTNLTTGNNPNWNECVAYCLAHNKALVIPEWGLNGGSAPNNGDDTTYVTNVFNLALSAAEAGLTVYLMPWSDTSDNPFTAYPNSLATLSSLVATAIADGWINGAVSGGNAIVRSTASAFPVDQQTYPGTAVDALTSVTFGAAGDLVIATIFVGGTETVTSVVAGPANGMVFTKVGSVFDATSPIDGEIEQWSAVVTAAAAGTTASITASLSAVTVFSEITVDEFTSTIGTATVWTPGTLENSPNASSTTLTFPSATSATSTSEQMYYGFCLCENVTPSGGTSPINGLPFTYTITSFDNVVAFNGMLGSNEAYQPIAAAGTAAISLAVGTTWTASRGVLVINAVATQALTKGTPYTLTLGSTGGTAPVTFTVTNLPAGLTQSGAVISGTPTTVQTVTVSVTAVDSSSPVENASKSFSMVVSATAPPPTLTLTDVNNLSGTVNDAYSFTFTASGGTGADTWSFTTLPTGITQSGATISGTPTVAQTITVTVTAADSGSPQQTASAPFTFTVAAASTKVPNAPATINGVTVPTTVIWGDEFPGPHLDVTKWLPGWFGDRGGGASSGSFGPNMTFLETNLSFTANGLAMTLTGTNGGPISSGLINSANWAGGSWTADATLGIPASAGPTFPGFVGWAGSPDGGGFGGTSPGATGPIYVEFAIVPDGSGTTNWNWQQWWLVQQGPASSNYDAVDELDVMETFNETASTVWYDGYGANHRVQSVAVESGELHTVGVMWTSDWCCFVYDGVASPVYTFAAFTHPQPPMGIIVAQGFSASNGCVFHSPSVQTTRYVRVFR